MVVLTAGVNHVVEPAGLAATVIVYVFTSAVLVDLAKASDATAV